MFKERVIWSFLYSCYSSLFDFYFLYRCAIIVRNDFSFIALLLNLFLIHLIFKGKIPYSRLSCFFLSDRPFFFNEFYFVSKYFSIPNFFENAGGFFRKRQLFLLVSVFFSSFFLQIISGIIKHFSYCILFMMM